ncbi:sterol carrier family protein [Streptomyces sp. CAU 1734]|uniref:maleylpyruvate isomerase family mycothiol-dependent enzyme n=1 Tax=Streptomyces sp. CAU 1734 TaxID=3140360 RepID=UPI00326167C0
MPTAAKRTRSHDYAKTRTAVLAQFSHLRKAVDSLTEEQLARPARPGGRTAGDVAAHLSAVAGSILRGLAPPEPPRAEITLLEWPFATAAPAGAGGGDTRGHAGGAPPAELPARAADRLGEALAEVPGSRPVTTPVGAMTLGDFLVTRAVELIVLTGDLNDATGLDIPYDRQALASCTRLLADALAVKAPGGSVEVRIPPFAVVQCVQGPRHTRGTPPNVVETDPLTWIRLATGRTGWAGALADAKVSASGERADLSALLPILG